jgi:ubiquinone/menaquinone biosynthesis C-methylase UbiE
MFDKRISPIYKNKMDFVEENLSANDDPVLDVGCGAGYYFNIFKKKKLVFKGIDIDKSVLDLKENVICADVQNLPFKSLSFKTIVCIDVLEHVEKDKGALKEIHRVLKRRGKLIISVPNKNYPFIYDPVNAFLGLFKKNIPIGIWAWGHKRLYTEKQIKNLLASNGFKIVKYERRSHFLVALFVNYIPYITNYIIIPIMKAIGLKRKAKFKTKARVEKSLAYRFYNFINNIDKKNFSNSSSINLCFVAKKI